MRKLCQYGLWCFQAGGHKIRKIFEQESTFPKEIIEFEFWINGELSKIGHHFSNKKN